MTGEIGPFNPQAMGFTGNPEADAMRYAQSKGISLEEAKNELRSKFGDPPQQTQQPGFTPSGSIDFSYRPEASNINQTEITTEQKPRTNVPQHTTESFEENNNKMSRKEAKAWIKAYRKEHNCSKKEAKEAFQNTFGYEYPKRDMSWIGIAGVGAFLATVATVIATNKGSGSTSMAEQKNKDYWANNW